MNYSDFVNEALCRGFEHPERLYMVAYKLDMPEVYTLCTEEEMAAAYYNDIFDVFDVVQEVELELDGILFPKYYIVEC